MEEEAALPRRYTNLSPPEEAGASSAPRTTRKAQRPKPRCPRDPRQTPESWSRRKALALSMRAPDACAYPRSASRVPSLGNERARLGTRDRALSRGWGARSGERGMGRRENARWGAGGWGVGRRGGERARGGEEGRESRGQTARAGCGGGAPHRRDRQGGRAETYSLEAGRRGRPRRGVEPEALGGKEGRQGATCRPRAGNPPASGQRRHSPSPEFDGPVFARLRAFEILVTPAWFLTELAQAPAPPGSRPTSAKPEPLPSSLIQVFCVQHSASISHVLF